MRVRDNSHLVRKAIWAATAGAGMTLLLALPALADDSSKGVNELSPAGPAAQHIADLWYIVLVPALVVLIGVGGAIIYTAFRFKERDPNFMPKQIGGNNALELTWTLIPAAILFALFGISVPQLFYLRHTPSGNAMTVQIVGHRFSWEFKYPGVKRSVFGTLTVPAGETINLDITSADVIHSWSVPRLAGRIDAIPGQHNTSWFVADHPGTYYGQCTELCGTGHATMTVTVDVLSPDDFQTWLSKQQGGH
jgi:cytochrome c oxidase subunit 2